jgi:hypothetical protein
MPPNSMIVRFDDGKLGLGVDTTALKDFDGLINDQKSDLPYLQDLRKLNSWTLSMIILSWNKLAFQEE